ncbi:MAG: DUF4256 domain-containing protein [Candidatus Peregrinibacteria bacterium]|nr:DUF4256 domain-containing protein [Candidatus Peregrinibacteria bacterium]
MAPEAKAPWDGVERRTAQAPVGVTALNIAKRTIDDGKTAVDPTDVRAGDLTNQALKTRVEGILDLANSDESKPASGKTDLITDTASAPKPELTPEQKWFGEFKARFDALPQLHQGVQWKDVDASLKADPEAMRKLKALDEKGHEMNVFGEKNGEIQFRSAQRDVTEIALEHRTIMYDKQAQTDSPQYKINGNAEDIAVSMGVELADKELYEQLRVQNGWVWSKTDEATRKTGEAFDGNLYGIFLFNANAHDSNGSFCAALRVKKA